MESMCVLVYNGSMLRNYNFRTTGGLQVFWCGILAPCNDFTPIPGHTNKTVRLSGRCRVPVPDAPEAVVPGMHKAHYTHISLIPHQFSITIHLIHKWIYVCWDARTHTKTYKSDE